jgi:hypothetical protein
MTSPGTAPGCLGTAALWLIATLTGRLLAYTDSALKASNPTFCQAHVYVFPPHHLINTNDSH